MWVMIMVHEAYEVIGLNYKEVYSNLQKMYTCSLPI